MRHRMFKRVLKQAKKECKTYLVEFTSIVITVVDTDLTTKDASVASDGEVIWHERAAVGLKHDLTLEESTLRGT